MKADQIVVAIIIGFLAALIAASAQAGVVITSTYDSATGLMTAQTWTQDNGDVDVKRLDTTKAELFAHNSPRFMTDAIIHIPDSITLMVDGRPDGTMALGDMTLEEGIALGDKMVAENSNADDMFSWEWKVNSHEEDNGETMTNANTIKLNGLVDQYFEGM